MATVYPTVYPNDMPPMLARQEPSYEYILGLIIVFVP